MSVNPNLIVVGASARAAAGSAVRAGLRPWTADLFADADLRAVCPGVVVDRSDYPHRLPDILDQCDPSIPCMYTGALENYPEVIRRIAEQRPLWGNGPAEVRAVRDPFVVGRVLRTAGLEMPEVWRIDDSPDDAAGWLVKPYASAGGRGISQLLPPPIWGESGVRGEPTRPRALHPSPPTHLHHRGRGENAYLQRVVEGPSLSAAYIADGGSSRLLGITRQLVGEPWLHAKRFHYCGSIGPLRLAKAVEAQFRRLGEVLTREFGLQGLFGIDAIVEDSTVWFIEINPRYTASMEVLEFARGVSMLAEHARVFGWGGEVRKARSNARMFGKAILFACADLILPQEFEPQRTHRSRSELTRFADVPQPGSAVRKGEPILTILTAGNDEADCLDSLRRPAVDLDRHLHRR